MSGMDTFFLTCLIGVVGLVSGLALSIGSSLGAILAISAMSAFVAYHIDKDKVVDAFGTPAVVGVVGGMLPPVAFSLPGGQIGIILAAATTGWFLISLFKERDKGKT